MAGLSLGLGLSISFSQNGPAVPQTFGGVAQGDAGTGIYSGYSLAWGYNFTSLNIVAPSSPNGDWLTTKTYSPGSRGQDTALDTSYDTDPRMTGYLDSNKGVAVGYDNMSVSGGVVTLQARKATAGAELDNFPPDGRTNVTAVLVGAGVGHFHADTSGTGDIIVEMFGKWSSAAPRGWHPTFWTLSLNPMIEGDGDEMDFEGNSTGGFLKRNIWTGGSAVNSAGANGVQAIYDDTNHTVSLKLNKSQEVLYIDGTQADSISLSANTKDKPAYPLLTNHIFDGVYETESYVQADWDTAGANGPKMQIEYIRIWSRTGKTHYEPLVQISDVEVDYGASGTLTLPSATTLWGTTPTNEYLQVLPTEENSPGVTHSALFTQFPPGVSYDSLSRTITADLATGNTGTLNFALSAWEAGGTGRPARFSMHVGPNITTTDMTFSNGTVVNQDLYSQFDCGVLVPKTMSISGLTGSGLSFDTVTGILSGTAVTGTYSLTLNCTNSRGQSATKSISLNVTSGFIFADDFNRANENLEASANWTLVDGLADQISVSSNHITCCQVSTADASYNCPDVGSDSMYVQLDWNLTAATPSMFFCGRHQDSNNFIGMRYNGSTNGVQIYKRVAGTFTNLGSHAGSITSGDTLRMEIDGTAKTVRGLINGTQVIAPIDITGVLEGVTKAGLISRTTFTSNWADNFGAGSL